MIPAIEKLYLELDSELQDIIFIMDSVEESRLKKKPAIDSWNASQILFHLYESESGCILYLNKKLSDPSGYKNFPITDEKHDERLSQLIFGLKSDRKFKAPAVFKPVPEDINYFELKDRFRQLRSQWPEVLEKFDEDLIRRETFDHPVIGKINGLQMMQSLVVHIQRHKEQIKRALQV